MSVELLDSMGTDLTVVNAARVSYAKESAELGLKDGKLISFLMREEHGSPFEHCVFSFRITAPLFVARQWMRHRISSFNEHSGRWSEFGENFYLPEWEDGRIDAHNQACYSLYQRLLAEGKPREDARMVLPLNLLTVFWYTVNARSLMNFLMLRSAERAQSQIRQCSDEMERYFAGILPVTHAAFVEYGRRAP